MKKIILNRMAQLVLVLLGVSFLTFTVAHATPSDPAEMKYEVLGIIPSEELLEQTREEMGLNDPVIVQYARWVKNVLEGNLGESSKYGEPVLSQMMRKLPMTIKLAAVSGLVMVLLSFPLGVYTAVKKNKFSDYFIRFLSFIGMSVPNFWLALILMYIFSVQLGWFNVISNDTGKDMVLPVATLVISLVSRYVRQVRAAILEELNSDYVTGARARGIPERTILFKHVMANAILPIITLMGLSIGGLLGGTAVIETIFSWRGIGEMVVQGIRVRDYHLIQGYVLWMAVIYVGVNLLVDIAQQYLDPQIRLKRRAD